MQCTTSTDMAVAASRMTTQPLGYDHRAHIEGSRFHWQGTLCSGLSTVEAAVIVQGHWRQPALRCWHCAVVW